MSQIQNPKIIFARQNFKSMIIVVHPVQDYYYYYSYVFVLSTNYDEDMKNETSEN